MKSITFLTITLVLFCAVVALPRTIEVRDGFRHAALGTVLEYREDRKGTLTIDDIAGAAPAKVRWQRSDTAAPGFGFSDSVYWVRFTVKNDTGKELELYLQQNYPLIDYCTLYVRGEKGFRAIKAGDFLPFSSRPVAYRNFIFPLPLQAGSKADCYVRYQSTSSMTISLELLAHDYFEYLKEREGIFIWTFYGFLILMFIYNLFILLSSRDMAHLYYILFILFFLLFIMGQHGTAAEYLWPDSPWLTNYTIPFTLGMLVFSVILFFRHFIGIARLSAVIDRTALALALINLAGGLSSLALGNYRLSMILTALLAFGMILYCFPVIGYLAIVKKSRQATFTLCAFAFLLFGAILYILKSFGLVPENRITAYSLQVGSTIQIVLLSLGMQDKVNMMRLNLMKAENKYRNLVDGSSDIIFSLDQGLNFLAVNRSIKTHLGYAEEDIVGRNLNDVLYRDGAERLNIDRNILEEHVSELMKNKARVSFRTSLVTQYTREPKEFTLKLEYTQTGGRVEILGKAVMAMDDALLKFMDSEKHRYRINNLIGNADILSYRLTRNLDNRLGQADIISLRVCLREIIINAIEHGSLGISFEEKTEAMIRGNYIDFLHARLRDRTYADRVVAVDYALNGNCAAYRITDQGGGFDYKSFLGMIDRANSEMLTHGRGLSMALQEFDVVEFNEKGNQILLVKYYRDGARRIPGFLDEEQGD